MGRAIHTDQVGLHIPAPVRSRPVWSLGTGVEGFVFTAGQPGVGAGGAIASGIEQQTLQAYENLRAILEEGGLSFSDVVKTRIFVTKPEDYEEMTKVRTPYYEQHFPDGQYPASTALVTPLAVPGLLIEIEAIACADKRAFDTEEIAKLIPLPLAVQPLWRLGVETQGLLWTTGQPGFDLEAKVVGPDIASQTRRSLENLESIVVAGGFEFTDVVKLNTFITEPDDFPAMLEVRNEFIAERFGGGGYPTATTIVVGFPPEPMRVETEAVAVKGEKTVVPTEQLFARLPTGGPSSLSSQAVRSGGWVFTSGQGALDSAGDVVGRDDIAAQTANALENVGAVLRAAGAGFDDIVKMTVWLGDAELYDEMTQARMPLYQEAFSGGEPPAGTAVIASSPVEGLLIELEAVAYVG
ncbi:MAG: RidA family protein [Actinomycetia bacterium]|nr:RidA family protein [Actinomycetes bacterium]